MNNLEQALLDIKTDSLPCFSIMSKEWSVLCEGQNSLYQRAVQNKPHSPITNHLLGILTKVHIEQAALIETHASSIQAMQASFSDHLGKKHADKFENLSLNQLTLTTHLWVYVQGYMAMDFSLANDHAANTARMISQFSGQDREAQRSAFMESFYMGKQNSPVEQAGNPLIRWFTNLFS